MQENNNFSQDSSFQNASADTRYFFICTTGKKSDGTISFNNLVIKNNYVHPTYKKCIELSNEKFPDLYDVTLISISELSADDCKTFVSERQ